MSQLIDLTGQRFGNLIVLKRSNRKNSRKEVMWECICDCGTTRLVVGIDLKMGDTKSCGKHRHKDEAGNRYGKLVVIERGKDHTFITPSGKTIHEITWICRCDCGIIKSIRGNDLRQGKVKTCGNHKLPQGEASFNMFYEKARKNAIERGYAWNLDKEQVKKITSQPCFYCGKLPSQITKTSNKGSGVFVHNGIDRVDNEVGYIYKNCVPCCKRCNYSKHIMSIENFRSWIVSVYEHFVKSES